jgi:serine/threonine protein kinase
LTSAESPITRVGTNIYAPPEHSPLIIGSSSSDPQLRLTPSADIYSLAKSVYTLITKEAPRAYAGSPISDLPAHLCGEDWSDDLIRVLAKATADDPSNRHQSVDEFWNDLAFVKARIFEGEESTLVRNRFEMPQPQVARGYNPLSPDRPRFEPVSQRLFRDSPRSPAMKPAILERPVEAGGSRTEFTVSSAPVLKFSAGTKKPLPASLPKRRSKIARRVVTFAIFLALFTGILYGTHSYMRGLGILPEVRNPFRVKTAVASTDVYLRPGPNTDNDPIGLVTKNSRIKIVDSQNNWYQVAILEQGRVRNTSLSSETGWLNGKFIEIDEN